MRRTGQLLPDNESMAILENGKTGILAVMGDEGYPYAVPVNYLYRDGRIYFHGANTGHKIDSIRASGKVSFCVISSDEVDCAKMTTLYRSVIVFGHCRVIDNEDEAIAAVSEFGLKFNPDIDAVRAEIERERPTLAVFEITIEHMTGKEGAELKRRRR